MRDGVRDRSALEEILEVENVLAQAAKISRVLRLGDAPDEQINFAGILRKISRNLLADESIAR